MRGNKKRDTRPEVRLRSSLHRRGFRFGKNRLVIGGSVRVRPDIVFATQRLAIFVDGCFWHRCPDHGVDPIANAAYWSSKLARNVARDQAVDASLKMAGWKVLRIWEHIPVEEAAAQIAATLQPRK